MTKETMVRAVAEKLRVTQKEADKYIDAIRDVIIEGLKKEGRVYWRMLGTFEKRRRKSKFVHSIPGRIKEKQIPEYDTVYFRVGTWLKSYLNEV